MLMIKKLFDKDAGENGGNDSVPQPNSDVVVKEEHKNFTQEDVNEIVGSRLERNDNAWLKELGLSSREEVANLVASAKNYNLFKDDYEKLKTEKLFNSLNIKDDRVDDVKAILKGKELPFTKESIEKEIKTHPEWLKEQGVSLETIGTKKSEAKEPALSEKEIAEKGFGIKFD